MSDDEGEHAGVHDHRRARPTLLHVYPFPFYPDSTGGAQRSTLYLLEELARRGWRVEILCGQRLRAPRFSIGAARALLGGHLPLPLWRDDAFGFPIRRGIGFLMRRRDGWRRALDERLDTLRPDVVLGHSDPACELLGHAAARGFRSVLFVRAVDLYPPGTDVPPDFGLLANSPFAADHLQRVTGRRPAVVLPFVAPNRYRVEQRERRHVTMINPIPSKGLEIVLALVRRLPDVPFLIVEGKWVEHLGSRDRRLADLRSRPNVTVWRTRADMRDVYAVTDVLLLPSQYEETFGRVVLEAQVNGIPVVASRTGGVPFTLGRGGLLIEPRDDVDAWSEAIVRLRGDPALYAELSRRARENVERAEFDPAGQVDAFVRAVASSDEG